MKGFILLLVLFLIISQLTAQAPQSFKYQAVARDASGNVITNGSVNLQVSIIQGSPEDFSVYTETFSETTNAFGLINIEVGSGTIVSGTFETIDWGADSYFLKTWINGDEMGTIQLLSVPYALYAESSGNSYSDADLDGDETAFSGWDKDLADDFDGEYSSLTGIPADIADGDDDTQLTEADVDTYVANNGFLQTEEDPVFSSSDAFGISNSDISTWNGKQETLIAGDGIVISGNEISMVSQDNPVYITAGDNIIISGAGSESDPYIVSGVVAGEGTIPILTREEILALSPYAGQNVFNITDGYNMIYTGENWTMVSSQCWPVPDDPHSGTDIIMVDGTTTIQLNANEPTVGTGEWVLISGEGGTFSDINDPNATFTGQMNEAYKVKWTVFTNCGDKHGNEILLVIGSSGPGPSISDIDGNTYQTVWIGSQLWMAENLKTTKYYDGADIPYISDNFSLVLPEGYCWYDLNETTYKDPYGGMYSFPTVRNNKLCPAGWHVPSMKEWDLLFETLGGPEVGDMLQQTDQDSFRAVPGGERSGEGEFYGINEFYNYWGNPEDLNSDGLIQMYIGSEQIAIRGNEGWKMHENYMVNVRCVQD